MSISASALSKDESLSPMARLLIEQACSRLVITYCTSADHHDLDRFLGIFTEDAVWGQPNGSAFRGHAEIRHYFVGRPKTPVRCHVCSNVLIDVLDADTASGTSMATVFRTEASELAGGAPQLVPIAVLEYVDRFVRQPDESWKISSRAGRFIYSVDAR